MYIQNSIEINGKTGKSYTFNLFSKSSQLPEKSGIYILTYCHPCGHLAGFKVNILDIGIAENLNLTVSSFRLDEAMSETFWNYTGIMIIEERRTQLESFNDLDIATQDRIS